MLGYARIRADENTAPQFPDTETGARSVAENTASGELVGDPVAATDADNDVLTYTLGGDDSASFGIDLTTGQLMTLAALDYETKDTYSVTVTASDSGGLSDSIDVTITVTNVDEPGAVNLSSQAPVVGIALTASLTDDDDEITEMAWQWASSDAMDGTFTPIEGATSSIYTPVAGDVGKHLRATASYTDGEGSGKSEIATSANMVTAADTRDPLLAEYDPNADGVIEKADMRRAVGLFFGPQPTLSRADMRRLVGIYFSAAPTQPPAQPSNLWRGITIAPENRCSPYDSDEYRYSPSVEPRIVAAQGGIYGPYTGTWFESIKETDIEHIVARSEAHDSGLCAAGPATWSEFASDLLNLTLASPSVNRHQKSDNDAAEWLPELNQCWYVHRTVQVRREYGLTIDRAEAQAIDRVLAGCQSTDMVVLAPGASATATATPTPTAAATPTPSIRPGTYAVGQDIDPGTYVGIAGTGVLDTCYWARLQGVSGVLDDILANDIAMGQFYIEVLEGDGYLETHCQITSLAAWPEPSELPESLQPGTYLVGRDIAAGTYRGEAGEEVDWCYWARLNGVTGELKDVAANHNATGGPFYVEVLDTDYALNTTCDLERVT